MWLYCPRHITMITNNNNNIPTFLVQRVGDTKNRRFLYHDSAPSPRPIAHNICRMRRLVLPSLCTTTLIQKPSGPNNDDPMEDQAVKTRKMTSLSGIWPPRAENDDPVEDQATKSLK